jgi:Meiotically up-regulated gene 113
MRGVYFLQAGHDGPIKIGWSADVRSRMSMLQTGQPHELRLLLLLEGGDQKTEKVMHRRFAASHLRGEWFRPSTDLLAFVNGAELKTSASATTASPSRPSRRPHRPRNLSPLGLLRLNDPDAWERRVRAALTEAAGSPTDAARILGISRPQMFRWMRDERFQNVDRAPPGPRPGAPGQSR